MKITQRIQLNKIILALGMLSATASISAAIMSMTLKESDSAWMYSSTQASNTSSRIALAFSVLNALYQYFYGDEAFSIRCAFNLRTSARLGCSLGAITALSISAYEASTSLAKPELPPIYNAVALGLSCFKFEDTSDTNTYTRTASNITLGLSALMALVMGLRAQNADFYHELLYTNLSLMFVALGYAIQTIPEMLQGKKVAFAVGLPMAASAILQLLIACALEKIPMEVLLGFSAAFFGLGAGMMNYSTFNDQRTGNLSFNGERTLPFLSSSAYEASNKTGDETLSPKALKPTYAALTPR